LQTKARRAYVRVEPGPGERFDIDWSHFGSRYIARSTRSKEIPRRRQSLAGREQELETIGQQGRPLL
jgi:hypothetical protein